MTSRRLCGRALLLVAVLNCLHFRTWGQVTFSRDWNAGKRSPADLQCSAIIKSADEFCRVLIEEFRQLAACETKSLLRFLKDYDDSQADIFMESQNGRQTPTNDLHQRNF
ncbi:uncharacterized protein LOC110841349 isoform X2 [Zootermopsis nevadensis]|uniref:Adipokinetic hormone n=1 Tax=Zootermopsis nevadensis TaxID=136037 RepID=A0A067RT52_ZOONE|nr:uncharacterized protein LOC110841349 isoform X2 [Zootermopsis nevadensis]XP_021942514.1 uncharacterized protein LOC110841349 isoform X2 [Zootermopsis nevadensis]XP_021942515.1 uncharacterized protein LOC110841349 isoform X2 [Zootermopsis nevadensis]XP_021942516.1 uncharacterized protein LOC110841349 isoform X2 [Zootermopsis nevadensis]KDR22999.1 hypothetical protein L798_02154 [Zootermopsis nevadensis]